MPKNQRQESNVKDHPLYGQELGEREVEIIRLVGAGLSNWEIGQKLFLSENTVKSYLARSAHKTGIGNRTALVVWLLARELDEEVQSSNAWARPIRFITVLRRFGYDPRTDVHA